MKCEHWKQYHYTIKEVKKALKIKERIINLTAFGNALTVEVKPKP